MTKAVNDVRRAAGQPAAATGADAVYRKLFDSFGPDKDGRISQWDVLTRLQRCGLQPGDPRIAEALAGLKTADGASGTAGHSRLHGRRPALLRRRRHRRVLPAVGVEDRELLPGAG